MKRAIIIATFFLLLISCENKKEAQLQLREQQLNERERQLIAKEADYIKLVKMRDSLVAAKEIAVDTTSIRAWPENFQQVWNSKMICRESNCSNYVIGDQRNETWKFTSDSTGLYMSVINNDKLMRVFRAEYAEDKIILNYSADSTATNKLKINVILNDIQNRTMHGTQVITGQNDCTAKFSVELTASVK